MHDAERPLVGPAALVGVVQPGGRGRHDRHRVPQRHVLARPQRRRQNHSHVLAVDVLHRDEVLAARLAHVVDLHDVLVMQVGGDPRLVQKHPDEPLVLGVIRPDPLEHDVALEAAMAIGAPEQHVCHATRREVLEHHVSTEPRPHCDKAY